MRSFAHRACLSSSSSTGTQRVPVAAFLQAVLPIRYIDGHRSYCSSGVGNGDSRRFNWGAGLVDLHHRDYNCGNGLRLRYQVSTSRRLSGGTPDKDRDEGRHWTEEIGW
ncbi:unnamed protein product, partial [Discosporangium mesarthrocarpum]